MKRVSKLFAMLIAAVGTMVFSACDTSTDGENFYVSYGEVVGTSESYTIKTDAGNTLHIVENLLPTFPVDHMPFMVWQVSRGRLPISESGEKPEVF